MSVGNPFLVPSVEFVRFLNREIYQVITIIGRYHCYLTSQKFLKNFSMSLDSFLIKIGRKEEALVLHLPTKPLLGRWRMPMAQM